MNWKIKNLKKSHEKLNMITAFPTKKVKGRSRTYFSLTYIQPRLLPYSKTWMLTGADKLIIRQRDKLFYTMNSRRNHKRMMIHDTNYYAGNIVQFGNNPYI